MQIKGHLLLKLEDGKVWRELHNVGKDLHCLGLGHSETPILYDHVPHQISMINGSHEVLVGETCFVKLHGPIVSFTSWIWYHIYDTNGVKGRAIFDYLADHPIKKDACISEFPNEEILCDTREEFRWKMFFDGASKKKGYGVGVLLNAPDDSHTPTYIKIDFTCIDNIKIYKHALLALSLLLRREFNTSMFMQIQPSS